MSASLVPLSLNVVEAITEAREHLLAVRRAVEHLRNPLERAQAEQWLTEEMRPTASRGVAYLDPGTNEQVHWVPLATLTAIGRGMTITDLSRLGYGPGKIGATMGISSTAVERAQARALIAPRATRIEGSRASA